MTRSAKDKDIYKYTYIYIYVRIHFVTIIYRHFMPTLDRNTLPDAKSTRSTRSLLEQCRNDLFSVAWELAD